jgi:hypothetical protein
MLRRGSDLPTSGLAGQVFVLVSDCFADLLVSLSLCLVVLSGSVVDGIELLRDGFGFRRSLDHCH